jgi:hypothetical protein
MWDELGIAPCEDPKAIRRAYAARLKTLDPDRNPEAFARLRRALEWALSAGGEDDRDDGERASASPPPTSTPRAADEAVESATASRSETQLDRGEPKAGHALEAESARRPKVPPPASPSDHDDVRDRALLIALDAALRRPDATQATALYYRAAATGALSLESAPAVVERLLAVAVDDKALDTATLRGLIRTIGLDAPRSRAGAVSELHRRVLARLRAEDWYGDLLVAATQRKGRAARRRAKIARLLLRRIGRHWHPRVDKTALKSWLDQYKTHAVWLQDRLDPLWIAELDRRLRRREILWLSFYGLIIGGLLLQFLYLLAASILDGLDPLWPLLAAPFAAAFLLWLLKMAATTLLKLAIPGWSGFGEAALLRHWSGRLRAIWSRWKTKKPGDPD